jgi:hypothetical protein
LLFACYKISPLSILEYNRRIAETQRKYFLTLCLCVSAVRSSKHGNH